MSLASKSVAPALRVTMLLSRIPLISPQESTFEKQYRQYQAELEKRLMWTFPSYYYFKKGTLSEHKFLSAQKNPTVKQPGVWYPKGAPNLKHNRERSMKQEVTLPRQDSQDDSGIMRPIVLNPTETEDDKKGILTSLERKLRNSLYLVVKDNDKNPWRFPTFPTQDDKPLHLTAEEGLKQIGGESINIWSVSAKPVAVIEDAENKLCDFLVKSHIVAGQFSSTPSTEIEHKWLTKDELKTLFEESYYSKIEFLLN
ncbi:mitochondrial 54S ribosomal protein mL46 KNAG_0F00630 [Huiozyma naganishii CBS 8797]|uniref:Large ribosomal subunit protein mL46 n=1 Tax=Huiozyma naganishii (strain ATCC MYA-139 / BCRC 22969 / CBS 8797 / KCTC 17520 / NBRC 10181 / NCYC 3082 / Yp74L-3) TaxID=1071383 RepID=J7RZR5_HUIN7|nr:hypothetical protein KNAG_0F00630 [Kazachstania naganishii CBS 8797]CCK70732.1 hypothetical protein KNAG_0F00630 [Kazachstania naganishii CBS 8797]